MIGKEARRIAPHWLPALLYMGLIWLLSSLELGPLPLDRVPLRDKGIHFLEYAALGVFMAHATLRTWPRHHPIRTAFLAFWVTCLWGLLDEIHQAFVPNRSSELFDLIADCAGAFLGVATRTAAGAVARYVRGLRAEKKVAQPS